MNCTLYSLLAIVVALICLDSVKASEDISANGVPHERTQSLLCGPNALYLSFALVGKKKEYQDVISACREYLNAGMSIEEVERILRKNDVQSARVLTSERAIASMGKRQIAIVLEERAEMSHLLVKDFSSSGKVRILDPLGLTPYENRTANEDERVVMLLLGADAGHSSPWLWPAIGAGVSVLGCILMIWSIVGARSARIAVLILSLFLANACNGKKGAIPTFEFNYGDTVVPGNTEEISHVFEFFNPTTKPIEIRRVVLSCSCASIDSPRVVEPMSTAKLQLKMMLSRSDFTGREASAIVETGSPETPNIKYVLKGRAVPAAFANPPVINFGSIRTSENVKLPLFIKIPLIGKKNDAVENVSSSFPAAMSIRVLSEKVVSNHSRALGDFDMQISELEVTLHPDKLAGKSSAFINVRTLTGDLLNIPIDWNLAIN